MSYCKKIINVAQTQAADRRTIENEPIASIDLMERASNAFVQEFIKHISMDKSIAIFCGVGNNGGDGLAIGRILKKKGYCVDVFSVQFVDKLSKDCGTNFNLITDLQVITKNNEIPNVDKYGVIIDAIFGSGLTRSVDNSLLRSVFKVINKSAAEIWAVDCPSGLLCDAYTDAEAIIEANYTISFQRPKLSFFLPDSGPYVNNWFVVDIGLDEQFIESQPSNLFYLNEGVKGLIRPRKKFSHKGNYGHALLVAGSYGKMGACILAAKECLKHGVGLLTTQIPRKGYEIIQTSVPEAMCVIDSGEEVIQDVADVSNYSAIGIGPGLDKKPVTQEALCQLMKNFNQPMVIDADALNIIAENPELFVDIPENSVLTPHPKEFERLFGPSPNSFDRLKLLQQKSEELNCIIVLKGAHTAISSSDGNIYFNTTGGPHLAQGGSGDRLTGIILSYLAQGYSSLEATMIGVYLHGLDE